MAEPNNTPNSSPVGSGSAAVPEQPQPATQQPQGRPCPKDCTKCGFQQHAFCAARMSFMAFDALNAILQRLDAQQTEIGELARRIDALQSTEAELIAPAPIQGDLFSAEG